MVDIAYESGDRWSIPDDRQLALRGRLQTGWSSYKPDLFSSKKTIITEDEQRRLHDVLEKRDRIQHQEQQRIGSLVKKLDTMRSNVLGDGQTTCLICGTKAGLFKDQLRYCVKCGKMVCPKCSIETVAFAEVCSTKSYFCVLCYEERQLWKRSGAWFFNSMPKYTLPENGANDLTKGTLHRNAISNKPNGNLSHGTSYLDLHRNDHDSGDDGSDSDADETSSIRAFDIKSSGSSSMSWHAGLVIDDDGNHSRRNAIVANMGTKHAVTETPSFELSGAEDAVDGYATNGRSHNNDHRYNSDLSLSSLNDNDKKSDGMNASHRHGSQSSLSSIESKHDKKHKLNIRRVMRKHSKGSHSGDDRSPTYAGKKSPSLSRSSNLGESPPKDSVSQHGSEQDIDALFKDYENKQAKTNTQQEYTGKVGMIEFTLQYDPNTQELLVIVHSCKGLKDSKGKLPALPYVKTYILPEAAKATKKRTSSIKKSGNPIYNETLVYHGISDVDIQNKGLRLSVVDENKMGNGSIIGEISIPLKNLTNRPVQQFRRILDLKSNDDALFLDSKNTTSDPGRIELALHYLSKQGRLVVGVIRCAGLKALDPNGYSDPYVKCYLLPDSSKKTKQKTQVKKKTLNPEFNEEFTYKIPHSELAKRTLHVSVWDYDMGRSNDFIGGITLGIESSGELLRHWFETLQTQDRRVIKWHTLSETCSIIHE